MRKAKVIYSEVAYPRETTVASFGRTSKAGRGVGGLPGALTEAVGIGSWRWLTRRGRIWLSLVGPTLEEGTKTREAVSY